MSDHSIKDYWPLLSLIVVCVLAAVAIASHTTLNGYTWMHNFMGIFFVVFGLLKSFNPQKFADGFSMYDLLAKWLRPYAYVYICLELLLGLFYLSYFYPTFTYSLTLVLMVFSSLGVITALRRGLKVNCACMGSVLKVPLSTVTLSEDLVMALMSIIMLAMMS